MFGREARFWKNIFSAKELRRLEGYKDPHPHAAGMFAAKEAVVKSLSFFGKKSSLRDIEIVHEEDGRPVVVLRREGSIACQVSISHTADLACAMALCERI
jgi:holo-[acyl-carrier protein] synthase